MKKESAVELKANKRKERIRNKNPKKDRISNKDP